MANVKITDLTLLASGSITNTTDVLPIVNVGGDVTNKTTVSDLKGAMVGGAGECSIIVGGTLNTASAQCTFIGGGHQNSLESSTISSYDGSGNPIQIAVGTGSVIVGGTLNSSSTDNSFIGGGCNNRIHTGYQIGSVIVGGENNSTTSGFFGPSFKDTFIGGGRGNTISSYGFAFLGGGINNTVSGGYHNVIVGGNSNTNSGYNAFIGGGATNTNSSNYGGILGGRDNTLSHDDSFIVGVSITSHASFTTHVNNLTVSGSGGTSVVIMKNLPTSNPGVTGQLWNDGGTLKIS